MANFENSTKKIDQIITKLETNLGVPSTTNNQPQPIENNLNLQPQVPKQQEAPIVEQPIKSEELPIEKSLPANEEKKVEKSEAEPKQETEVKAKPTKQQKQKPAKTETAQEESKEVNAEKVPKAAKEEKKAQTKKVKEAVPKEEPKSEAELLLEDFAQVDFRVGRLQEVWKHPNSENLYCEKIDIGIEVREIASGLQKLVPLEEMKGLVIVVANLKPKKLADFMSNGMVLCASNEDHTEVQLLRPPEDCVPGERVFLEQCKEKFNKVEAQLNPKKKTYEKVQPLFKTDANCIALWNGIELKTSKGTINCKSLKDCHIS